VSKRADFSVIWTHLSRGLASNARQSNTSRGRWIGRRTQFRDQPQDVSEQMLEEPRQEKPAFEKCASILERLQGNNFISFPAEFGSMYVASQRIAEMVWISNSACHLILESGKFVDAKESCNDVHKALPRE
jgi:hypothetical protein